MEISLIKENSIKIKTKKTTVVVDPVSKIEAQIVIQMDKTLEIDLSKIEGSKLLIQGPGEYEVSGTSVKVKSVKGELVYSIEADFMKVLLFQSSALEKIKEDEEEYSAVIIKVDDKVDDNVLSVSKEVILYGDLSRVELPDSSKVKTTKVNLKKQEELIGKVIMLASE